MELGVAVVVLTFGGSFLGRWLFWVISADVGLKKSQRQDYSILGISSSQFSIFWLTIHET